MKTKISVVWILAFIIGLIPSIANAKRVACVGDSITYGYGLPNRASDCYPAQLARMLRSSDSEWETQNFGANGATLLRNKGASYVTKTEYGRALASEPDVVVMMLGTNDSARASISEIGQNFTPDYLALIDAFAQLPSQPEIYVCYPPPILGGGYGNNNMITDVIMPLIDQLPTYREVQLIDLYTPYTPLEDSRHLFPDNVHPNTEGARVIAEIVASMILGFRFSPDLDGDYKVGIEDLLILIEHWDQDESFCDIAPPPFGDGIVDRADLEALMAYWGQDMALVAYWKLDETEGDIAYDSAAENDAVVLGEAVWVPGGGCVAGGLQLDGIDDYVQAPGIVDPGGGVFSICVWVKGGAPGQVIVSQEGGADWLLADAATGALQTDLAEPGTGGRKPTPSGPPLSCSATITDGDWHRVGFTWDGETRRLYVDDVEVAADTQTSLAASTGNLLLGASADVAQDAFWTGLIDEVRIYNRAINP